MTTTASALYLKVFLTASPDQPGVGPVPSNQSYPSRIFSPSLCQNLLLYKALSNDHLTISLVKVCHAFPFLDTMKRLLGVCLFFSQMQVPAKHACSEQVGFYAFHVENWQQILVCAGLHASSFLIYCGFSPPSSFLPFWSTTRQDQIGKPVCVCVRARSFVDMCVQVGKGICHAIRAP